MAPRAFNFNYFNRLLPALKFTVPGTAEPAPDIDDPYGYYDSNSHTSFWPDTQKPGRRPNYSTPPQPPSSSDLGWRSAPPPPPPPPPPQPEPQPEPQPPPQPAPEGYQPTNPGRRKTYPGTEEAFWDSEAPEEWVDWGYTDELNQKIKGLTPGQLSMQDFEDVWAQVVAQRNGRPFEDSGMTEQQARDVLQVEMEALAREGFDSDGRARIPDRDSLSWDRMLRPGVMGPPTPEETARQQGMPSSGYSPEYGKEYREALAASKLGRRHAEFEAAKAQKRALDQKNSRGRQQYRDDLNRHNRTVRNSHEARRLQEEARLEQMKRDAFKAKYGYEKGTRRSAKKKKNFTHPGGYLGLPGSP